MNYNSIYKQFLKITHIPEADFEVFMRISKEKLYKKNTVIMQQGFSNNEIYFIKGGDLMTYFETPNKNPHIIQFGKAGWWSGDIESLNNKTLSNFSIKSISDTSILVFDKAGFDQLLIEAPSFERYFRLLFQKLMTNFQIRVIQNITLSADERYHKLLQDYPKCELIFPQKYIAAYLAITPEFLSKMKSRAKELAIN
jgi:CRP-like cAMP-binding protein